MFSSLVQSVRHSVRSVEHWRLSLAHNCKRPQVKLHWKRLVSNQNKLIRWSSAMFLLWVGHLARLKACPKYRSFLRANFLYSIPGKSIGWYLLAKTRPAAHRYSNWNTGIGCEPFVRFWIPGRRQLRSGHYFGCSTYCIGRWRRKYVTITVYRPKCSIWHCTRS